MGGREGGKYLSVQPPCHKGVAHNMPVALPSSARLIVTVI